MDIRVWSSGVCQQADGTDVSHVSVWFETNVQAAFQSLLYQVSHLQLTLVPVDPARANSVVIGMCQSEFRFFFIFS